ncbi:MAG: efflux RND transporter periplasmic adaptor subunit, partial [Bacteroidetes bacterium]|nr:efflux RND transporter periplasmic adaptor subunit [Bacteroidota bacterium]
MNNKSINITLFVVVILLSVLSISSCSNHDNHAEMAGSDEYYTCSMDPQVIENKAGNCPICHMKLIKVKKNNLKAGQIKLSAQQIKLANITYDTVAIHEFAKEITLTGTVTFDQNLSNAISARVQGRIENLSVKNIGDYVIKGQLLYEIYSEELNSLQEEYLLTFQSIASGEGFREAAKSKLLLYGMNESQVNQLKQSKTVFQTVPVYATIEGFVTEVSVAEGSYVSSGSTLFRFASLQSLWVEAQVYLPYVQFLKLGTEANFSIPAASEKLFSGEVIFIAPEVQSPHRFVLARFHIINLSEQVKPGMLVNITLQTEKKKAL